MVHDFRGASILVVAALLFLPLFLGSAEMPMQLSRAELVHQAGYGEERLSSVLITGTILCDACLQPGSHLLSSHVRGAKVAIACKTEERRRKTNWAYGMADEYGEFIIDVPSHLHAIPLEEDCVIRVLRMPKNSCCRQMSEMNHKGIKLSSVGNSIRVYTAGVVRLSCRTRPSQECLENGYNDMESAW
ncbi:uncharacterized protein LOC103707566 [Phoenix dactylifera]|uniref:Uncharacterized protein LOC103707566 n=1 Tax=Phoenix dactylifera TaxID=42345 RepID=A0A8B7C2L2_PHODC|nr:uncharacterized protein LOC103707566 [Phoenix dactylifera]